MSNFRSFKRGTTLGRASIRAHKVMRERLHADNFSLGKADCGRRVPGFMDCWRMWQRKKSARMLLAVMQGKGTTAEAWYNARRLRDE